MPDPMANHESRVQAVAGRIIDGEWETDVFDSLAIAHQEIDRLRGENDDLRDILSEFASDADHQHVEAGPLCGWCGFNWPCAWARARNLLERREG